MNKGNTEFWESSRPKFRPGGCNHKAANGKQNSFIPVTFP